VKAAVLEGTGKPLVIKAVPDAFAGDRQALVRLKAAALNHRDLWIQLGQYANIKVPAILGSDGSGTVAAVGSDVDGSWLGQEVMINPSLDWGADQRAQGSATVFQASLKSGFLRRWFRRTTSFRMTAVMATFLGLPAATRR